MTPAATASRWIAASVRNEVLMRALPALRHDMAAPVSLIRMSLLLLRRQVASPTQDPSACEQRIAQLDAQIGMLVDAVRSLRDWELGADTAAVTRAALAAQCAGLMRTPFDLNGVTLDTDAVLALDAKQEPAWPDAVALRYLLLGALCHLHDTVHGVASIHVEAEGDAGLWVRAFTGAPSGAPTQMVARPAPRGLLIDAASLQSLAEDVGHSVEIAPHSVRIDLRAG